MEAIRKVTLRSALHCFVLGSLVFASPLRPADLTIPKTFVPGTPATADAVNQNLIATALRNGTPVSVISGSDTWNVGTCGGMEINANAGGICSCTTAPTLRPCIGNANWGGVGGGTTCGGANQSIQLIFR